MKEIELTKGMKTLVDDEDYDMLSKYSWQASQAGKYYYAKRSTTINKKTVGFKMHRVLMGNPKGMCVDHIDGNTLNNQKSNLRICTTTENKKNRRAKIQNTSKYLGVCLSVQKIKHITKDGMIRNYIYKKWMATIGINRKIKNLGYFNTEEDAARAYNEAAKKYHGEFANLNII